MTHVSFSMVIPGIRGSSWELQWPGASASSNGREDRSKVGTLTPAYHASRIFIDRLLRKCEFGGSKSQISRRRVQVSIVPEMTAMGCRGKGRMFDAGV